MALLAITTDALERTIQHALECINPRTTWADTLGEVIAGGRVRGSLKGWIAGVEEFDTLQLDVILGDDGRPTGIANVWAPGTREIRDRLATMFSSGTPNNSGSVRDYDGMVTYAATPDYWAGFHRNSSSSARVSLVFYRRAE